MIYKNFRVVVFIRVLIIVLLALALAVVVMSRPSLFIPGVIGIALIASVVSLIQFIEKSNRDLTHFLLSIRQGAFTESYASRNRGKIQEELSSAMNEVVREFAHLNEERELHYQFLQALNENIGIAILSFDREGKLRMINPAAKRLLRVVNLHSIEDLKTIDQSLYDAIKSVKPEERLVVRSIIGDDAYQLSIQAKEIVLQGNLVRIILLQNLSHELEAKEIDAWHQLMRVLTHEIMNSVTPIVSLSSAMRSILTDPNGQRKALKDLSHENEEDIYSSLSTILSRSKGLVRFVTSYKEYAKPMQLNLEEIDLVPLIKRILNLFGPDLEKMNIDVSTKVNSSSVIVKADAVLIEQVIINILKNAMDAVPHDDNGKIDIRVQRNSLGGASISVTDNGVGINSETLPKIFVPFFTTKEGGTGIGLSLSRQIMKLHNGNIQVSSTPGKGSKFVVEWN